MVDSPFPIFKQFSDRFDIRFFDKSDHIQTDTDLAQALKSDRIASLRQMHGKDAVVVDEPTSRVLQADGIATDTYDLWLSIRAADCQIFVVYAPQQHVAGVLHAGWKGLKAGMIPSFFALLKTQWNISPSETYVGMGPSLCLGCSEFTDPTKELEGLDPQFFHGRNADLIGVADAQLDELGIPQNQRERDARCTRCNPETLWTYRGGDKENVLNGYSNVLACRLKIEN